MCGSIFKLKVKVQEDEKYLYKQNLITEDDKKILTENGKELMMEWGE